VAKSLAVRVAGNTDTKCMVSKCNWTVTVKTINNILKQTSHSSYIRNGIALVLGELKPKISLKYIRISVPTAQEKKPLKLHYQNQPVKTLP
jgi:hypothetical protein